MEYIGKVVAYEKHTGERHVFEIYHKSSGASYIIMLDGSFLADAENSLEVGDEVEDAVKWFGWIDRNPNFA